MQHQSTRISERLSYQAERCTVRYVGKIQDKSGEWLGVEWDDPTKGKHDGTHEGVRYFTCVANTSTAGSFVRPNRPSDPSCGLVEAMTSKYASNASGPTPQNDAIEISGKLVQEIGFERIEQQLADLKDLKIVILDRMGIRGIMDRSVLHQGELPSVDSARLNALSWLSSTKIEELDLSENLLESWDDVMQISNALPRLQILRLVANRLTRTKFSSGGVGNPPVKELNLDRTLLSPEQIAVLIRTFPQLRTLTLSHNAISSIPSSFFSPRLSQLDLSNNTLSSLTSLSPLASLPCLSQLSLRGNPLSTIADVSRSLIFQHLTHLDLSSTHLPTLSSLDPLTDIFPSLTRLLTHSTPLSSHPSSHLLTIARLATITELNYAPVTPAERTNAELYYLSQIAQQLSDAESADNENTILKQHPRWADLCRIYDTPDVRRKYERQHGEGPNFAPGTLGARVAKISFAPFLLVGEERVGRNGKLEGKRKLVPLTTSIYALMGIAAGLFAVPYASVKLVLETDEYDPLAAEEFDDLEMHEDEAADDYSSRQERAEKAKWTRREEPLTGTTKPIGDWLSAEHAGLGKEVRVRVEISH